MASADPDMFDVRTDQDSSLADMFAASSICIKVQALKTNVCTCRINVGVAAATEDAEIAGLDNCEQRVLR